MPHDPPLGRAAGEVMPAVDPAILQESPDDLYENAPCGNLSTLLDGSIIKINTTLLRWLGYTREDLVGCRFSDLLTVGGKIYHETHFAPLLAMQRDVAGVALDLKAKDGTRFPVLVTSTVKTGDQGQPQFIQTVVFDARDRRAYERELVRARQSAEADRERLRTIVTSLQRSLLPGKLPEPPGMQSAAYYHMASPDEVGGDFYDLFPLGDDRWGFLLGDVCGKGVDAAAVTALARYTLRAAAVYDPDPAAVISNLNTVLCQEYLTETYRYCTVIFGILLPAQADGRRIASIAGGGHPPAVLIRADGTTRFENTTTGLLVGVLPEAEYSTVTLTLHPGDTLLLYTDGIVEARTTGPFGRLGEDALLAFLEDRAPARPGAVIGALTDLLKSFGDGVDDDTALMAIGISPRAAA